MSSGSFVFIFQMSVFLSVFFFFFMVTIVCRSSSSSGLSRVLHYFKVKESCPDFFRIKKRLINATDRSFETHEMLDCRCYWQHSHEVGRTLNEPRLTCSLFLSRLICSPVTGILIHLSTLKIWVKI